MPARLPKLKLPSFTNGSYTGLHEPPSDARSQTQHTKMTELALEYEKGKPAHPKHPPLSAENFVLLIRNSRELHGRLDILCRLVLVLRGIAKDSYDKVAAQLRISKGAVEQAYCVAFDTLELAPDAVLCNADLPGCHFDNDQRVTG